MLQANLFGDEGKQTENLEDPLCIIRWTDKLINQQFIFFSAFTIFLSIIAFLGNALILIALHKESFLHPPSKLLYRCLAATDLCRGLIVGPFHVAFFLFVVHEDCEPAYTLSAVSLFTITTISVDRLLALFLGLRYKQVVTLKRTYLLLIIFWMVGISAGASHFMNRRIAAWCSFIVVPICLITASFSYLKIFHRLHHGQRSVPSQEQPSQPVPLNLARYRKAVYSALWVQLAMFICYLPYIIVVAVLDRGRQPSNSEFVVFGCAETLVFLNSSLNIFLYCWKIREVRQAVKESIRQALCCPWNGMDLLGKFGQCYR